MAIGWIWILGNLLGQFLKPHWRIGLDLDLWVQLTHVVWIGGLDLDLHPSFLHPIFSPLPMTASPRNAWRFPAQVCRAWCLNPSMMSPASRSLAHGPDAFGID